MTRSEDPGPLAMDPAPTNLPSHETDRNRASLSAVACSCAALIVSFIGLAQFDLPAVRYVRSVTTHLPGDHLIIPWMAFTSNAGNWIGEGWHLAEASLLLLAIAWVLKNHSLRTTAIQTLVAHGIAALLSNGLKHVIGRPRPKFTHSGDWQVGMAWTSGWDSFPSGHSTASFAVATVLAKRFPMVAPLCIGIAAFVALSRVLRGAHFPTDVMGGAALGIVSGVIAAAPLKQWRTSIVDGLCHAAIGVSAVFAFIWALARPMDGGVVGLLFTVLAIVAVFGGVWLRRSHWSTAWRPLEGWQARASIFLMAYGLAALTTSPLVLSSVGLACLASWFTPLALTNNPGHQLSGQTVLRESLLVGGLVLAIFVLTQARGVLPFR